MRILFVANTLPPRDLSGVGEQVLQLASGLRERGHDVDVLGRGPQGAPGPKILFPLNVVPAFLGRLRSFRPDVVQVHESDGVLAGLLTRIVASTLSPPPVLLALLQVSYREEIKAVRPLRHDGRELGRPGSRELRFRYLKGPIQVVSGSLTAWLADRVLAPSETTAEEIRRDYGVRQVGVVPNVTGGLEWDAVQPHACSEPGGYLLYVGRLRMRKGVEVLLEAMRLLPENHRRCKLWIVGDGEQRQALERRAEELELRESVRFLGRRDPQDVRDLLAASQALVVPSIYEGMPLVVLEAMDRGVPVVASAVSGIPEVVIDGETGWLVPPENPPRLARALEEVLGDHEEASRRGLAGRRRVAENFRPGHAAERWEAEVARVVG